MQQLTTPGKAWNPEPGWRQGRGGPDTTASLGCPQTPVTSRRGCRPPTAEARVGGATSRDWL